MDYLVTPDYVERNGSLYLKSDHMSYGRDTLNSNWHQAREAEPKDYDINSHPTYPDRNLHSTTYERMGNLTNWSFPKTSTQSHLEQIELKDDYRERASRLSMVDMGSFIHADIDRKVSSAPRRGFGAVLPRHHPDHDKMYMETTHTADFTPPYPYTPYDKPFDFPDNSAAYRKCHSQFTDATDYRRWGKNIWKDESGVYANTPDKRRVFPTRNPIGVRLD